MQNIQSELRADSNLRLTIIAVSNIFSLFAQSVSESPRQLNSEGLWHSLKFILTIEVTLIFSYYKQAKKSYSNKIIS